MVLESCHPTAHRRWLAAGCPGLRRFRRVPELRLSIRNQGLARSRESFQPVLRQ